MFGKRHRPLLCLYLRKESSSLEGQIYERKLTVGIKNSGRAVARFPNLRFKRARY